MTDALKLIVLVLVCYRLAMLLSWDNIFKPIRNWIGTRDNDFVREHLGYFVHCPYCLGIWIALILALIYYPSQWFLMALAIAGGQAFIQRLTDDQ